MASLDLPGTNLALKETSRPYTLEDYGGLDTKAKRPAISPKDFFWLENWMPIGPGNMRTLYGHEETPIYTTTGGRTILNYAFYNIGATRYAVVFLDNGTAVQVNTDTLAVTTISAVANTFWNGTGVKPAVAQYQAKYLIITSKVSDNAYWAWDGSHLFGPGTLAPQVLMTNSGQNYTSLPTITAYGGTGSGATFLAELDSQGHVVNATVTNPGSGYGHQDQVTLVITGGGSDDQARATATVSTTTGGVALVLLTNGGSGYSAPLVTFAGGGGSGAKAFVSGAANGVITDITVTDPGSGYTSPPTVTIADSGGGTGSGATAIAETRRGQITAITVNSGGSGYVGLPDVVISEPNDGDFPLIQAEAYATVVAGAVTAITVTIHGVGYRSATVQLSGGNNSAEAEVSLMPFGLSGTTLETYQNRVWIGDNTKFSYTGADSITDVSGVGGGGSKPITDSFLRERLVHLEQANGFLYRFGDSSINVISNVQTSVQGVTTFNDANVDPQIGSAWRDSIGAFGRALVFANPTGVYALYGGAAEKVSGPLDGLFEKANFTTGLEPTACVTTIFGIRVYCLLFTTTDPFTHTERDLMCMWDGQRWFIGSQEFEAAILAGQEINSTLTGYGSDATHIYRLFRTPSETLVKTFATKLLAPTTYIFTTTIYRVYFIAQTETAAGGTVAIALENEQGANPAVVTDVGSQVTWVNNVGATTTWINNALAEVVFTSKGLVVRMYDDSEYGQLVGAQLTTQVPDLTMISLTMLMKDYAPNG